MAQHGKFSYDRYEEIKREVIFMFEETETDTYPIDCFEIARRLYYRLYPYSMLDNDKRVKALETSEAGYSRVELDPRTQMFHYCIYYNDQERSIGNIRWTIFHELGHIFLGHHDNPTGIEQLEEAEANFFAKYAMCPPPLLNATKCQSPIDVCIKFNTSDQFSCYAYEYFQNWLNNGPINYLPYEIDLLRLFHIAAA